MTFENNYVDQNKVDIILSIFNMAEGEGCDLSLEGKVEIVRMYSACNQNAREVRRLLYQKGVKEGKWSKCGIDKAPLPAVFTIHRINKTFNQTGCVSKMLTRGRKRKKTVTTAENMQLVAEEVFRSPDIPKSISRLADSLDISETSIVF